MSILTRFYANVETGVDGVILQNVVIKGSRTLNIKSGRIQQIIIEKVDGPAETFNIDLRYDPDSTENENLVYLYTDATFPFVDSNVNAPFSLKFGDVTQSDLTMFVVASDDAVLSIRIDYEIYDNLAVKPRAESC
jgi:hypothetical protein